MRYETPDIYEDLLRRLITARLQSGKKLKPADLQGDYGCSANTVREVLLRLSMVGVVSFESQRGFRVSEISPERRQDVTRFRVFLEQEGAALSMKKGGVAWESRLTAAHHKLKHIEQQFVRDGLIDSHMELWSDAELEYHETLISACGSDLLRSTYSSVYLQFRQQMIGLEPNFTPAYFTTVIQEHQAILDAALARDADACRAAIESHLARHLQEGRWSSVK